MEKRHHRIDDLFRQGLTNLEISPTITGRSGFLQKAGRELKKRSVRRWLLPGAGIILGVAILIGAFLVISQTGENNAATPAFSDQIATAPLTKKGHNERNVSTHVTAINSYPLPGRQAGSPFFLKKRRSAGVEFIKTPAATSESSSSSGTSMPTENSIKPQSQSHTATESSTKDTVKPAISDTVSENRLSGKDSIKNSATVQSIKEPVHPSSEPVRNREWNIRTGIYYTPEWIFNTLDKNKYVNNFGVEALFRFGSYSIRTGVGLSITRGFNEIAIETKPYLGGYSALDHITYHWDAKHYHLIPTVYTSWKEVFDTVLHNNYYTREKEYTYLQIPMILGYDFYNTKWFSLGARVGPVMSVLIKCRELSSAYDAGKDIVVSVNNITPDRIHLNWQAIGGINASFRLSRRFILELEPNIRYYFDSVYEKSGPTDKPWSVGFRSALLINF